LIIEKISLEGLAYVNECTQTLTHMDPS
jgi:hypothetical protein